MKFSARPFRPKTVASKQNYILLILLSLLSGRSYSQADFEKGYQAFQSYHASDVDSVNLANGSLILNIPLLSYEQRGGLPPVTVSIRSNATTFQSAPPYQNGPPDTNQYEVASGVIGSPWGQPHVVISPGGLSWRELMLTVGSTQLPRYVALDDSGATHSLGGNIGNQIQSLVPNIMYSVDGSGMMLQPASGNNPPLLIDRNGSTGGLVDPNGNKVVLKGTCAAPAGGGHLFDPNLATWEDYPYGTASATSIVDSIGRTIPNPGYLPPVAKSSCLVDLSASYYPASPDSNGCETYNFPSQNGGTVPLVFCYAQTTVSASIPAPTGTPLKTQPEAINETWPVLTSVTLPNQTQWTFTYDNYGQVQTITLPTGATISYTYATRLACGNPPGEIPPVGYPIWPSSNLLSSRMVASRTLDLHDGHPHTWTYKSTIGSGWTGSPNSGKVTVTDPDLNDTVHTFSLVTATGQPTPVCGPYETQTQYYQGSSKSGTLLKTVATQYSATGSDEANPTNFSNYISVGVFPQKVTTSLPGSVSRVGTYTYDSYGTYQDYIGNTWPFSFGDQLETTESDWGGMVLRTTLHTSQWQSTYNYYAANLVALPCLDTVFSGNYTGTQASCTAGTPPASQAAQTSYAYDQVPSPTGTRGNLTSVTKWLKGGTSPEAQTVFNTNGMAIQKIDPKGNVTKIAYDSTGLYPNMITHPQTGSIAHVEIPAYDANTGELLSRQDENKNVTSFQYDSMRRLTNAAYPDGGTETFQYTDTIPPSYTLTKLLNSAGSAYIEVGLADTFGRKLQTRITSDTQGTIYADTQYDDLGRVASQSNPYRSATDTTYGVTQFTYDAIGRKTIQTNPDSSVQQWCYMDVATNKQANCHAQLAKTGTKASVGSFVDFQDESGNDWQRNSDGLGRLTSVMEPNGATAVPSMQTSYAYDALGNLQAVTQTGNGTDTPRVQRKFTYDTLSRLSTALNPESGATSYAYDIDGNVLTRTQPLVNASSGTQALNYCYDPLNRKTAEYTGSLVSNCSSPSQVAAANLLSAYTYDSTALGVGNNAIGHLTDEVEYTPGTAVWERSPYKYDTMGRLLTEQQCAFGSCTNPYSFTYSYDYAGNILGTTNGLTTGSPITVGYAYDSVARLSTVTSATPNTGIWASSGFPSTLYNVKSYGPAGLVSATYGNAASTLSRGYDNRLRITSNTITAAVTLYNYGLTYAPNSNVATVTDSVIGNWTYTYDTLDRVTSATASTAGVGTPWGTYKTQCWTYDSFGNRTGEGEMAKAVACPNPVTGADHSSWAEYNTSNQLTANSMVAKFIYDDAGNTLNDGIHRYVYDLDGRICAVTTVAGGGTITQYVYDAEGRRVAKGTLTTFPASGQPCSAPTAANGFSLAGNGAALYLRGAAGDQDTELDGSGNWRHTNVFVGGGLTATYDTGTKATLSFNYSDWLGSKRVQSAFGGAAQNSWASDPYGAYLNPLGTGADATEHHFVGKERDSESGNDYFGARYYESGVGRWVSPDWSTRPTTVPYTIFGNPQTLNLFAYTGNNPFARADIDGHGWPEWAKIDMSNARFLGQEVKGLWSATGGGIVAMTKQLADGEAASNFHDMYLTGHIQENLKTAGKQFLSQTSDTLKAVGHGDPNAIGQTVGIAATVAAPFAKGVLPAGVTVEAPVPLEGVSPPTYAIGHGPIPAWVKTGNYVYLDIPQSQWSLAVNEAWVQSGIDVGANFKMWSSPTEGSALFSEEYGTTVFARELDQLNNAGHTTVGDTMVAPGSKNVVTPPGSN
jgi:RHS repeat-associated protein